MVKKAVTIQERLEQLIAGAGANPDGPALDVAGLQAHVTRLNELEYAARWSHAVRGLVLHRATE